MKLVLKLVWFLQDRDLLGINMSLKFSKICVSALSGGGGKTLLSLGLSRACLNKGYNVKTFKKGPDYIDSAWLSLASKNQTTNLDPFFLDEIKLKELFWKSLKKGDKPLFALIEGNRGLFDGLDVNGSYSTAQLARTLNCPILLSLDCTKMTRTSAAIIDGICNFEENLNFCGVVLNQIGSSRHEFAIRSALEKYTDIPILGAISRMNQDYLPERHMGIATLDNFFENNKEINERIEKLADIVKVQVDIDKILKFSECEFEHFNSIDLKCDKVCNIGYVNDKALWFYYPENLEALENEGANLISLSLFDDLSSWNKIDALYLGGGFPEDYVEELCKSKIFSFLKEKANEGLPIYAECGGLVILTKGLKKNGKFYELANILPFSAEFCDKPQGLGYVEGKIISKNHFFPENWHFKGHEFHYSRLIIDDNDNIDISNCALKLNRGFGLGNRESKNYINGYDGYIYKNIWASYSHVFAPSCLIWAKNFVKLASKKKV